MILVGVFGFIRNGFDLGIFVGFYVFNPFLIEDLMWITFIYVVCCCSVDSGSNSGLRVNF